MYAVTPIRATSPPLRLLYVVVEANVTFERAASTYWTGTVAIAGFATQIEAYAFDRTSRTSSAAWVFKGNF